MGKLPFRLPQPGFIAREGGQAVVLVALMFTIILAGGAMGIDIGRFYAERRFVQNAVDSAALACALSYARGGDAATAWSAADAVLQQRYMQHNPLGLTITYASRGGETYDNAIISPANLNNGILPVPMGCRVAVTMAVPTYLMKVVSPAFNTISMVTRAYAKAKGGLLPSVVKRYENTSDTDGVDNGTANEFIDHTMAAGYDHSCTVSSPIGCTPASVGQPGAEFVIFGADQKANNDSSFRGYIGLDIRDFSTEVDGNLQHLAYNQVPADATVNTLKDYEAAWINEGYPGPDICVVTPTNFLPCAQIAAINGSSSGIFVDNYQQYIQALSTGIGDILLFQLYDGTVKTVPDFTMNPPVLNVPTSGAITPTTVAYSMSSQFASSASTVCTEVVPDNGSLTNGGGDTTGKDPFVTGKIPLVAGTGSCTGLGTDTFSANPTLVGSSSYNQSWAPGTATGAQQGIYEVFLRGTASAPYYRIHSFPVKVVVGNQATEYKTTASVVQQSVSTASLPGTVTFNTVADTGSGPNKWQTTGANPDGPITIAWESCPRDSAGVTVLTCYIGSPGTTSTVVTASSTPVPMIVATTGVVTQKSYLGWVRTTANDHSGNPVVHLWQVRLDVDQLSGGTTDYVDVIGYAAFQITRITSNNVYGKAVSGAYYDPNDPALIIAKKIVLVPWETP